MLITQSLLQTQGVTPYNMCILKGFPTILAKANSGVSYPFGIWFANSTTLYVADEGSGTVGKTVAGFYTPATLANNTTAGLQKWIFRRHRQVELSLYVDEWFEPRDALLRSQFPAWEGLSDRK